MKIEVLVNGKTKCIAGIDAYKHLGVHLIAYGDSKKNKEKMTIRCAGSIDKNEWQWKNFEWPSIALKPSDTVSIRFDSKKKVSPAVTKIYNSGENYALIKNKKFARKVSALTKEFRGNLIGLIEEAMSVEGAKNGKRFRHAVGYVVSELFERIDVPIQRDHPDIRDV
jgi:hypothetical protein